MDALSLFGPMAKDTEERFREWDAQLGGGEVSGAYVSQQREVGVGGGACAGGGNGACAGGGNGGASPGPFGMGSFFSFSPSSWMDSEQMRVQQLKEQQRQQDLNVVVKMEPMDMEEDGAACVPPPPPPPCTSQEDHILFTFGESSSIPTTISTTTKPPLPPQQRGRQPTTTSSHRRTTTGGGKPIIKKEEEEDADDPVYLPPGQGLSNKRTRHNNNTHSQNSSSSSSSCTSPPGVRVKTEGVGFDDQLMLRRAHYTAVACMVCRQRKRKCDGKCPCTFCSQLGAECKYMSSNTNTTTEPNRALEPYLVLINELQEEVRILRMLKYEPGTFKEEEDEDDDDENGGGGAGDESGDRAVERQCYPPQQPQSTTSTTTTSSSSSTGGGGGGVSSGTKPCTFPLAFPPYQQQQPIPPPPPPSDELLNDLSAASIKSLSDMDVSQAIDMYYIHSEPLLPVLTREQLVDGAYADATPHANLAAFCVYNALVLLGWQLLQNTNTNTNTNNNTNQSAYTIPNEHPTTATSSSTRRSKEQEHNNSPLGLEWVVRTSLKEMFDLDTPDRARALLLLSHYHVSNADASKALVLARQAQCLLAPIPVTLQISATSLIFFCRVGGVVAEGLTHEDLASARVAEGMVSGV